ncbi:MAG: PVC-type heme-binding CxxCH protein [Planctomycetota bacterium]|nr:PVC-type heme-binding CxxCH protein [Planctomycetota bacterium]
MSTPSFQARGSADSLTWKIPASVLCALLVTRLLLATDEAPNPRTITAADLPAVPATEPAQALDTFQLAKGCRLELVAAEPLVADPVDACFDAWGRMFVAEMHGYPFSQEPTRLNPQGGGKKDAGIIRLLEDTDGDGRMDRSVVFADKISWPTSVCCYNGGLFVLAPQYLYYFKDTDGDGRADVRETVLSGFGRDNVQSLANNLKWGLDQKIYLAAGRNPLTLKHRGKPLFPVQGADLRFDPRTEQFEVVTGGQQFGHSMDDWGNRFVCSNSNHMQQIVFPRRYLARNPALAVSNSIRSIAADGASARVFRTSPPEPWRIIRQQWRAAAKGYKLVVNKQGAWEFLPLDPNGKKGVVPTEYPVGYFTSATGITVYRGGAYPAEFQGNAFVGDVGGNIVHRKSLTPRGVLFTAQRADQEEEMIRSSDNWFRPVNFVNAPDGTLYVLDMYRQTVEHPYSIPAEIKQFLDLQNGSNRGRIYRIVPPGIKRMQTVPLGDLSSDRLVRELESDNAWNRETAQRLLWQRGDKTAAPQLLRTLQSSSRPLARLHALYTLAALDVLTAQQVVLATRDAHPRIREHAVRAAEPFLSNSPELIDRLAALHGDPDDRVRFQLAFSLGETSGDVAVETLAKLARAPQNGQEIRTALLSSVGQNADRIGRALLPDVGGPQREQVLSWLSELCLLAGADRNPGSAVRLLASATATSSAAVQQVALAGLGEGLSRRGATLPQLLNAKSTPLAVRQQVQAAFERSHETALDERQSLMQRSQAIGVLAFASFETVASLVPELLSPRSPQVLQRALVAALAQQSSEPAGRLLLANWRTYSPQLRRDAADALLSSPSRIALLLTAVSAKEVRRSELGRDQKQLLLKHPNQAIRNRSQKVLGGEVNSDRAQVVQQYRGILELDGDADRGFTVFKKKCSTCHRIRDTGYRVAPELTSVQNKSAADLLIAILDPNREAQPNFNTYTVVTENGRIFNGIIAAETATSITLKRAEARQDVVLRNTIEELAATGVSLMPEGLEKDLSPQDLADVIALIQSIQPTPAKQPATP